MSSILFHTHSENNWMVRERKPQELFCWRERRLQTLGKVQSQPPGSSNHLSKLCWNLFFSMLIFFFFFSKA